MTVRAPEAIEVTADQFDKLKPYELTDHLERGRVLLFPTPPLELPNDEELRFLKQQTPEYHTRKNISYYPEAQRIMGIKAPPEIEQRTRAILMAYQDRVEACLQRLILSFTPGWRSATSSLRVFEENNRDIPIRARSDKIHLDAGTYGAALGYCSPRFYCHGFGIQFGVSYENEYCGCCFIFTIFAPCDDQCVQSLSRQWQGPVRE